MKTDEQMSDLAKGHSGPPMASLRLKELLAHSVTFTLETESAQMFCWHPQTNNQTPKNCSAYTEAKEALQDCHSSTESQWKTAFLYGLKCKYMNVSPMSLEAPGQMRNGVGLLNS